MTSSINIFHQSFIKNFRNFFDEHGRQISLKIYLSSDVIKLKNDASKRYTSQEFYNDLYRFHKTFCRTRNKQEKNFSCRLENVIKET